MSKLGIITGMVFEASILRRAATSLPLHQRPLIVCLGLGREAAQRGASEAVNQGATALMSFGIAAGLDPVLVAGDVVIASAVHDAARALPCDQPWAERLGAGLTLPVVHAAAAHAPRILATPEDKAGLRVATDACIADMESFGVGEIALRHHLAFAALRVVADGAADVVPAIALTAASANGHVDMMKTLGSALIHPSQILALIRLGRRTDAARQSMRLLADLGLARSFFL